MKPRTGIYDGEVVHARLRPREHKLRYRVFSIFLDLGMVEKRLNNLKFFSFNRFNFLSFYSEDFGNASNVSLRQQIASTLQTRGITREAEHIYMLAYPRVLGYVFNPITIYYIYDENYELHTLIYEVTNTFRERVQYVIPVAEKNCLDGHIFQNAPKKLYVSPFAPETGRYGFHLTHPGEDISVGINFRDVDGPLLKTRYSGKYRELQDSTILKLVLRMPLFTLKVIAAIHFEALRLWLKGVPVHRHTPSENHAIPTTKQEKKGSKI